jgi:hypothetical protein
MSPVDEMGILITGFVGPILYGCRTVSKTRIEEAIGDFVESVDFEYVLTGHVDGRCCLLCIDW